MEARWIGRPIPENCRRVQTACVQAAALFSSELRWKAKTPTAWLGDRKQSKNWLTKRGSPRAPFGRPTKGLSAWKPGSNQQWYNWTTVCDASPSGSPASHGATSQRTRGDSRQRPRTKTAVRPWMLEWQRRNGPHSGGLPSRRVYHDRGRNRSSAGSETARPTRPIHLHGWIPPGKRSYWLRSNMEEGSRLERPQDPHGLGPGGL